METVTEFLFLSSKVTVGSDLQPWNQKTVASWQESYDKPRQCIEKQRHHFANKGPYSCKVVAKPRKKPGFLASGGEEFNPGPETRLDHSEILYNKVLLKYKRDGESF